MTVAHFLTGFLMIVSAFFALFLTLRGYDWAIDKFEHLLFKADYPVRLGDKISKKIIRS
jgi:hypothetical protein